MRHRQFAICRTRLLGACVYAPPSMPAVPRPRVRLILAGAVKPPQRLRMGDALATLGREVGLSDADCTALDSMRDNTPARMSLRTRAAGWGSSTFGLRRSEHGQRASFGLCEGRLMIKHDEAALETKVDS